MNLGAHFVPDGGSARYFDGRTPVPRAADVRVDAAYLTVLDAERGTVLTRWPLREVVLHAKPARALPALLGRNDPADARRVVVADPDLFRQILGHARHLAQAQREPNGMARILLGGLVGTVLLALGATQAWPPLADRIARAVPAEWEAPMGANLAANFSHRMETCTGTHGQAALDALTRRLVGDAPTPVPLTVRVLQQPVVNAMALPGGHIFVFSQLIQQAESPNEVAGVLAHEIAHALERHVIRQIVRSSAIEFASKALIGASTVGDGATWFSALAFSREFETEADLRAIAMLKAAGIGAEGMGRFFARMEKTTYGNRASLARYLSSHPPTAERRALAEAAPTGGQAMTNAEWRALRAICGK